jgi:DNA-binding GntR family transcriptional regulator
VSLFAPEGDVDNVQLVHARIRAAIISGELAPGDEISQVKLAKHLGVSRTPLREALRMLQSDRLVEARPSRMVRVARLSVRDAESIYTARVTLEALAARLTVPLLSNRDVDALHEMLVAMDTACREHDYLSFSEPHRLFHRLVTSRAGDHMTSLLADLAEHAERYRRKYTLEAPNSWVAGAEDHAKIYESVATRDALRTARLLVDHLARTAFAVIAMLERNYDPEGLRVAVASTRAAHTETA